MIPDIPSKFRPENGSEPVVVGPDGALLRPKNPPHGTRFVDPRGFVVEWDDVTKQWREPASGRIA
jgi:hypothetical protein